MTTPATVSSQVDILKRLWGDKFQLPVYQRSKAIALMKKDTKFGAEGKYVVVNVAPTAGGSADFATAKANQKPTSNKRFFVTRKREYQLYKIEGELLAAAKTNREAMVNALKHETGMALASFGKALGARVWSGGGGSIGRVDGSEASFEDSKTLVLRVRGDIVKFEVGMTLQVAPDDGTAANPAGARTGTLTVASINRSAGTLEVTDADLKTGIAAIADGDYIFRAGDYAKAMTGIPGWNPIAAPTSGDSFFGLDRSTTDIQRVSGHRFDGNGNDYEKSLIRAIAEARGIGIEVTHCWVHPEEMGEMIIEMGAQKEVDVKDDHYGIGFKGLRVKGANGDVIVNDDPYVPMGHFWMNRIEDISLETAGDCPIHLGGSIPQQLEGEDAVEGRLGCYGNFFHNNPGQAVAGTW